LLFIITLSTLAPVTAADEADVVVTVDSTSLRFSPSQITVTEGQAVRFMWAGQALAHNAVADDGLFDSGEPERDVDYRFVFEVGTAGTHTFVASLMPVLAWLAQSQWKPLPSKRWRKSRRSASRWTHPQVPFSVA